MTKEQLMNMPVRDLRKIARESNKFEFDGMLATLRMAEAAAIEQCDEPEEERYSHRQLLMLRLRWLGIGKVRVLCIGLRDGLPVVHFGLKWQRSADEEMHTKPVSPRRYDCLKRIIDARQTHLRERMQFTSKHYVFGEMEHA